MSGLKHLSVEGLLEEKAACEKYISDLKRNLGGQQERLWWLNAYLEQKTGRPYVEAPHADPQKNEHLANMKKFGGLS